MKGLRGWMGAVLVGVVALAGCHDRGTRQGLGAFTAEPEELSFGAVALGRDRVAEITLTNRSRVPYNVTQVSSTIPNVEVLDFAPLQLDAGATKVLKVRFAPKVEGAVQGALEILTDEAGAGGNLSFDGRGVKALVEANTQALDYGRVDVDTAKVLEVHLTNPTEVEAEVQFGINGPNADAFSSSLAGKAPLIIAPGEVRRVPIAFRPVLVGLAEASARFSLCASCEPVGVSLTGEGITGAIEIFPTRIDFGRVSLGATASEQVLIRNQGNEEVVLEDLALDKVSAGQTELSVESAQPVPVRLAPGAQTAVTVRYAPQVAGPLSPQRFLALRLVTDNAINPKLAIDGEAGASCVALLPKEMDFGTVPEGMSATRRVDVFNRCSYDVTVTDARTEGEGGYFSVSKLAAMTVVPAGKLASLEVTYTPKPGELLATGTLSVTVIELNAESLAQIPLTGRSKVFQPCTWTFEPGALDFGAVPVGAEVTLAVALENAGADQCFVGRMNLVTGSDPEFTAEPVGSTVLDPGQHLLLRVTFKPSAVGAFAGMAEGWVNHPTNNHPTATLQGAGVNGCFALQPTDLDYGTVKLSCGPKTRTVLALNACQGPITVTDARVEGTGTTDFSIGTGPAVPFVLQGGQQAQFQVVYGPQDDGEDAAALRVTAGGLVYTAGLGGTGLTRPTQTDVFVQDAQSKVDVLFVIDNSGSMMEEQQSLGQNFASFLSAAQAQGIDYHIGVTTTGVDPSPGGWSVCPGGAEGGEAGRLFPITSSTPRIITPYTPNAAQVFATNVNVGWCHWNEQGLEAAYRALSPPLVNSADDTRTAAPNDGNAGFLRPEAKLAVVFVSDEDDYSSQPVTFYETFFKALKNDPTLLTLSAIVGPTQLGTCPTASSAGGRYLSLANATGGIVESICTQDWSKSLQNLSLSAFGPKRRFPLSQTPEDATQVVVEVDGAPVTGTWTYEAATNSVVFDDGKAPNAGSVIEITYPLGC